MKIALSAESTLDLSKELIKNYDVNVIPFTVLLGEDAYADGDITGPMIFDYVEKTKVLPRTCAVNDYQYREYFNSLLEKGYDAVIHISLSSEISSSCSNAEKAAKKAAAKKEVKAAPKAKAAAKPAAKKAPAKAKKTETK